MFTFFVVVVNIPTDIDECSREDNLCEQLCNNTIGSYYCNCTEGYRLSQDQHGCEDIDECLEGIDECEHTCHNDNGSYSCNCTVGYKLDSNGFACNGMSAN